jgi:hypothetical protein
MGAKVRRARFGPGLGLALAVRPAGLAEVSGAQGWVLKIVSAKRFRNDLRVPLTLEGPVRTMRGIVPALVAVTHSSGDWRTRRDAIGLAVVLAGAAARYGEDRRQPVTGGAVRGSRRAWWASAQRARRKAGAPQRRVPQVEPRPLTAGHPGRSCPSLLASASLFTAFGPPARRAGGAPLKL